MHEIARRVVVLGFGVVACGGEAGREAGPMGDGGLDSIGADTTSAPTSTGEGDASGETATVGDDGTSAEDDGPRFDLGIQPDQGVEEEETCKKVDFLFVIDDSGSMGDNQDSLVNSFPGFISGIMSTLSEASDYHVGIVGTGEDNRNPEPCDIYGGMVIATGGDQSSDATCGPYAAGRHYMTVADNLAQTFNCAAQLGEDGGDDERHLLALGSALDPAMLAPGACNDGFLRPDALLVVTIITDEDDQSDDELADWYGKLLAAKNGIETNIVVLTLALPDAAPTCAFVPTQRLVEFTNMFTYGFLGDVCSPSYDGFFQDALMVVQEACESFTPPG